MNELIIEAINLIDKLNDEYQRKTENYNVLPFAFFYSDVWMGISYLTDKNYIWDSEDNDRLWDEDMDKYEPLETCVRRRAKEYNKQIMRDMFK